MREIKFKYIFKHRKDGDYQSEIITLDQIEDNDIKDTLRVWKLDGYELVDRLEYTGTNDKNGNEIYDGNIVDVVYGKHYNEPMGLRRIGRVKYCNKTASFIIQINNSKVEIHFYDSRTKDIEVIGNIYSNPELLTKE